ncbi:hypothetical protein LINPERPRIM_LOCUS10929 [Linum perenne]
MGRKRKHGSISHQVEVGGREEQSHVTYLQKISKYHPHKILICFGK